MLTSCVPAEWSTTSWGINGGPMPQVGMQRHKFAQLLDHRNCVDRSASLSSPCRGILRDVCTLIDLHPSYMSRIYLYTQHPRYTHYIIRSIYRLTASRVAFIIVGEGFKCTARRWSQSWSWNILALIDPHLPALARLISISLDYDHSEG